MVCLFHCAVLACVPWLQVVMHGVVVLVCAVLPSVKQLTNNVSTLGVIACLVLLVVVCNMCTLAEGETEEGWGWGPGRG